MTLRAEHLQGLLRDVDYNQRITRLWVLDDMVNLIDDYIGEDEAKKVQKLYMDWALDKGGNYNEFKKLFTDIISGAEDLPEAVKWRLDLYVEFLFPPPMPT